MARLVPLHGTAQRRLREPGLAPAAIDPATPLQATVIVRPRVSDHTLQNAVADMALRLPHERRYLTDLQCTRRFGARRADLLAVAAYARTHGIRVAGLRSESWSVVLEGSLAQFARAFGVDFKRFANDDGDCITFDGPVQVPRHLSGIVTVILGFDTRALTQRHQPKRPPFIFKPIAVEEVAAAYGFPATTGKRQVIGLIALGGGFHRDDIEHYFRRRHLSPPRVTLVPLAGAGNDPADPQVLRAAMRASRFSAADHLVFRHDACRSVQPDRNSPRNIKWTIEATGDIEIAGHFAPGARIVVYRAPDTLRGWYEAFAAAIMGAPSGPGSGVRPDVISCSWGRDENIVPGAFSTALERMFQAAALKGVTICCSSGDEGDAATSAGPQTQYPASSPYVLSVGGSSFRPATQDEQVWNETIAGTTLASGGGFSALFARPSWQTIVSLGPHPAPGRGLPDVAAKADIARGYAMLAGQVFLPMGGTSAAAPMWAALVARVNEHLGTRAGYLTPLLYTPRFKNATRDIVRGRTSARYYARPGWNPCTGLGSPNGRMLAAALDRDQPSD